MERIPIFLAAVVLGGAGNAMALGWYESSNTFSTAGIHFFTDATQPTTSMYTCGGFVYCSNNCTGRIVSSWGFSNDARLPVTGGHSYTFVSTGAEPFDGITGCGGTGALIFNPVGFTNGHTFISQCIPVEITDGTVTSPGGPYPMTT